MNLIRFLLSATLGFSLTTSVSAISIEALPIDEQIARAETIIRGSVQSTISYRSGDFIFSDTKISVREIFRGAPAQEITLTYRGGEIANAGESITDMPIFQNGDDRLFFFVNEKNGSLRLLAGPESAPFADDNWIDRLQRHFPNSQRLPGSIPRINSELASERTKTSSSTEGLLLPPRRTTTPDRGEPIGVLVDADYLPPGISIADALKIVESALSVWSESSSIEFRLDGLLSFGTSARDIPANDRRLRIQLHDAYGIISGSNVLGIGGQAFGYSGDFPNGGSGGRVFDVEFHETFYSYVVLSHSAPSMQNRPTFEAVLAHEIGHALGLGHSSEDPNETDAGLRNALMYFQARSGAGSALNSWDIDAISRIHPLNPPPFGFDRVLRPVTAAHPIANTEVNHIRLKGYSLHADDVHPLLHSPTSNNGNFHLSGSSLSFEPSLPFSAPESDPGGNSFYEHTYVRYSDDIHLSAPVSVKIIAFLIDTAPAGNPDGLPDNWMEENFGSKFPVDRFSGPDDDPDGDGFSNLEEFLAGTDPLDAFSKLRISTFSEGEIEWNARPYDLYEIESSADLLNWKSIKTVRPTTAVGNGSIPVSANEMRNFYRIIRVD